MTQTCREKFFEHIKGEERHLCDCYDWWLDLLTDKGEFEPIHTCPFERAGVYRSGPETVDCIRCNLLFSGIEELSACPCTKYDLEYVKQKAISIIEECKKRGLIESDLNPRDKDYLPEEKLKDMRCPKCDLTYTLKEGEYDESEETCLTCGYQLERKEVKEDG